MKVLSVLGSPRKNGYTSAILESYVSGLKENNDGLKLKDIYLEEMTIKGCKGCNACQHKKVDFCISEDDMIGIYKDILDSDIIILASPVYFFHITAQMKTMVDRLYSIARQLKGKKLVFLSTFGAEHVEQSGVKNAVNMFEKTASLTGLELVQQLHISTAGEKGQKFSNESALKEAYELAKTLS